jgi:hypothetical protein
MPAERMFMPVTMKDLAEAKRALGRLIVWEYQNTNMILKFYVDY